MGEQFGPILVGLPGTGRLTNFLKLTGMIYFGRAAFFLATLPYPFTLYSLAYLKVYLKTLYGNIFTSDVVLHV